MKKERRWARIREVDIDSKKNVFSSRRDCVGIVSALIPRIESEIIHRDSAQDLKSFHFKNDNR